MIIVGDIAVPYLEHCQHLSAAFEKYPSIFKGKTLVCNFEGLINETVLDFNEPILYNHPSVINSLSYRGPVVAALANNHVLDLPEQFDDTIKTFRNSGIAYTGAGRSREVAEAPALFSEDDMEVILFNACWNFLLYNQKNPYKGVYVEEINERKLIDSIFSLKQRKNNAAIMVFLHWNFDLETLPFPMYRQFAMSLIDAGASFVVGTHSHCVQGGETYGNGHIVYGLGNFFMPHGVFAQGKVNYPPLASLELVLEWDVKTSRVLCHWFEYQYQAKKHELIHLGTEDFENSVRLNQYSPYRGMNQAQYLPFYRSNRRKKFLIPVFKDYRNNRRNRFYTFLLILRARFARSLAKRNIIKWQN